MRARIKAMPIRVNPKEIILVSGLLADALHIECEDTSECEELWNLLGRLKREGVDIEKDKLTEKQVDLIEKLRHAGLLYVENREPCLVSVIGKGDLALQLRKDLVSLGAKVVDNPRGDVLRLYAYDFWSPRELREIDKESLRKGFSYIPIYLVFDTGIIGPHVVPNRSAGYACFEAQLMASMTWAFRVLRDYASAISMAGNVNPVHIGFLASLASMIVLEVCRGNLSLVNRAVVVDFRNIFIDLVKVYKAPICVYTDS